MARHRTYTVQTAGRLPKLVVCDRLTETEQYLEFWLDDEPEPVLVLRVPRDGTQWQLKSKRGRHPAPEAPSRSGESSS
jgi:hypothetical protein